jgi:hypothetical protein
MDINNIAAVRREALQKQLDRAEGLRLLPFDDPKYEEWRAETGRILDEFFGALDSEQHPCTRAFLDYRIPKQFSANRAEMQDFYQNILRFQTDLLKMYLHDIE